MPNLRSATIRLAATHPELRHHLLPLLKVGGDARPFGPGGPSFSVVPQREIAALGTRLVALFEQAVKQFQSEYAQKDPDAWSDLQDDMSEQRFPTSLVSGAFFGLFPGGVMDEETRKSGGWTPALPSMRYQFPKIQAAYVQAAQKDPKVLALVKAIHTAYLAK